MTPFLWMGFSCLKAAEPQERDSLPSTTGLQKLLVVIWSTPDGWNAELNLKPPNGLEPRTAELGTQCSNH